jgi:hypothetical protein
MAAGGGGGEVQQFSPRDARQRQGNTRAKIGAINAIVDLDWSDTNDAPIEVWK